MNSRIFYETYHGVNPNHLQQQIDFVESKYPNARRIWLTGDSSLDNKYWLQEMVPHNPIMAPFFAGPNSSAKPDVAHAVNQRLHSLGMQDQYICINAAVEESTLEQRASRLTAQDELVRDRMKDGDVVVVSAGGNDVVLRPNLTTISGMLWLTKCARASNVSNGTAFGLEAMSGQFQSFMKQYIQGLTVQCKPKQLLVCGIYYPDENSSTQSWANRALSILGYNKNPSRIQSIIDQVFPTIKQTAAEVLGETTDVKLVPFSKYLDGKASEDYAYRVEPSAKGGVKMAQQIVDSIVRNAS